jgi:hypothetical protein
VLQGSDMGLCFRPWGELPLRAVLCGPVGAARELPLAVREEAGNRERKEKRRKEKKRKGRKRKENKNYEKFSKLENF